MRLVYLCAVLVFLFCCEVVNAQIVRLHVTGSEPGDATAFCVGKTDDGAGVYLTAKHNFRGADAGQIRTGGAWHAIRNINQHQLADVASFESQLSGAWLPIASTAEIGATVEIAGFGPAYHGRTVCSFRGVLSRDAVDGERGLHPIPGDSGGPILQNGNQVVGVIQGYDSPYHEAAYRSDYASQRLATRFTGLSEIRECLSQCYQSCPSGGCPIWIRNEYRQPMVGIGLPVGPPQRVQVAEPVPRQYVPASPQMKPETQYITGPPGPIGPQGPAGPQGRSVTQKEVEAIVNAWLDANRDALTGPAGPQGPQGPPGESINLDLQQFESRITQLEQRPFRIVLSSDGKIIDDETYQPGEPVVLDLKRLRSVSGDK